MILPSLSKMNLPSAFRLTISCLLCVGLIACAGPGEPTTPAVIRAPAPQGYEKTITNYLAFRIRAPQKNVELSFGQPEPGDCALDGYVNSRRGWVVPVSYATRTGEVTGKETIRINIKQYYFWFLGDTIAGITPRMELCPGLEATLIEGTSPGTATGGPATSFAAKPETRERVDTADQSKGERSKGAGGQKPKAAPSAKKSSKSVPKTGNSGGTAGRSGAPRPAGETSATSPVSTDTK